MSEKLNNTLMPAIKETSGYATHAKALSDQYDVPTLNFIRRWALRDQLSLREIARDQAWLAAQ